MLVSGIAFSHLDRKGTLPMPSCTRDLGADRGPLVITVFAEFHVPRSVGLGEWGRICRIEFPD
jgi:hypothetical protein